MSRSGRAGNAIWVVAFLTACAPAADPPPSIHEAAEKGDVARVKVLLAADAGLVRALDKNDQMPLHVAANYGRAEVVELLLKAGAAVNARAYNDFTPLHLTRDPRVVKILVAYKADLEAVACGETPLERAASGAGRGPSDPKNPWSPVVAALREAGARYTLLAAVRLGDADGAKRLLAADPRPGRAPDLMREAAGSGHAAVVRVMLELGADPTEANYGGLPLLHFALDHPEVVKVLLAAGASPKGPLRYEGNGPGLPKGVTLLHETADRGRTDTAKLLIEAGADVDARAGNGTTPFQWAAAHGHLETVKLLLKRGADARGDRGAVAMTAAARQIRQPGSEQIKGDNDRRVEVVRFLAAQGVPLDLTAAIALGRTDQAAELLKDRPERSNEIEPGGQPLTHRAVMLDRIEILARMLDAGAPINAADEYGDTVLHAAAFWGRDGIVKLLIRRGATVDARNKNEATPLHKAARCAHPEVARVLLEAGADAGARDKRGRMPLDWAEITVEQDQRSYKHVRDESRKVRDLLRERGAKK